MPKFKNAIPMYDVPESQKQKRRNTPWGDMSYIDYKHKIEFTEEQIDELCKFSKSIGINFFCKCMGQK